MTAFWPYRASEPRSMSAIGCEAEVPMARVAIAVFEPPQTDQLAKHGPASSRLLNREIELRQSLKIGSSSPSADRGREICSRARWVAFGKKPVLGAFNMRVLGVAALFASLVGCAALSSICCQARVTGGARCPRRSCLMRRNIWIVRR